MQAQGMEQWGGGRGRLAPACISLGKDVQPHKAYGKESSARGALVKHKAPHPFCNSHIKDKRVTFLTGWQGGPEKGRGSQMSLPFPSPAGSLTSFGPLSSGSPIKFVLVQRAEMGFLLGKEQCTQREGECYKKKKGLECMWLRSPSQSLTQHQPLSGLLRPATMVQAQS